MEQIDRGQLKEGLATLSVFYNAPELTTEQRHDLLDLLDALAREVVFSRRHFLAPSLKLKLIHLISSKKLHRKALN